MLKGNNLHQLHLHLIVFIWGFTAILGALISLDALPLVWWRMLLAIGFMFLYVVYTKKNMKIPLADKVRLLCAGLIIAVHWYTFFEAIKVSNISITLACLSTGALFASILEPLFYKRKYVWYEMLFGLIVLIGLYWILEAQEPDFLSKSLQLNASNTIIGAGLALLSAFLSALFSVINGKFVERMEPPVISFYELCGGVLFFTLFMLYSGDFLQQITSIQPDDWIWMILLSSICTAYAFIASVHVMKYISPFSVMLTINLEPVYGITLAYLVFQDKEKMNSGFYLGALVILITVILNGIVKNWKKK